MDELLILLGYPDRTLLLYDVPREAGLAAVACSRRLVVLDLMIEVGQEIVPCLQLIQSFDVFLKLILLLAELHQFLVQHQLLPFDRFVFLLVLPDLN